NAVGDGRVRARLEVKHPERREVAVLLPEEAEDAQARVDAEAVADRNVRREPDERRPAVDPVARPDPARAVAHRDELRVPADPERQPQARVRPVEERPARLEVGELDLGEALDRRPGGEALAVEDDVA